MKLICKKCAKFSEKTPGNLICNFCYVAEDDDSDDSDDDIDYAAEAAKPSNFQLVATVSYNKDRRDFDYEKFNKDAFEGAKDVNKGAYEEKADAIYDKHANAEAENK